MRKSRYSEQRIALALQQAEAGAPVLEVCPARRRIEVKALQRHFGVSERRALQVMEWPRGTRRRRSRGVDQTPLRMELRELAASRPRYGYSRLTILLRRQGWHVNHKRVYRLYRQEGLQVLIKRRKKLASASRVLLPSARRVNERWTLDFVSDAPSNGRRRPFRSVRIFPSI